ncbi:MAG: hypothetical protein COT74_08795 [Bdellovibrionales bacterium CG10_big_fil_rev_8_21_14_0_10_45_34]|nr:MAG: hypothetical protein COT74_08795 [Bdellovibrionales bacterium CG10_big_fil_rev_8_21_14_0_10_45_34]
MKRQTPSGKFVLRVGGELHTKLKKEAEQRKLSLNDLIVSMIKDSKTQNTYTEVATACENFFGERFLGLVVFGSHARGESRASSDIDLLVIVDPSVPISRELYRTWDHKSPTWRKNYSFHFVHLPHFDVDGRPSGLWLESALEGIVLVDKAGEVSSVLSRLRNQIASGMFRRNYLHGHPYWVKEEGRIV